MRNFYKSSHLIFLSLFIFLFTQCKPTLKDIVKHSEKATFIIYTFDEFGSPNGLGTGFFITNDGIGITNFHVLKGAAKALVKMNDSSTFEISKILSQNKEADLVKFAINNPEGKSFEYLKLSTKEAEKGEKVIVIGNPEGLESTVSEGIVSSLRKLESFGNIIQITAPISSGSSGSPIMNSEGQVLGIATFQLVEGQNLNFGVPVNKISEIADRSDNSKSLLSKNLIIINIKSHKNPDLELNSIENRENSTVVNCSFTDINMAYGEQMVIWTKLNQGDSGFFIKDNDTQRKFYIRESTISDNRNGGTEVKLGETKRFTMTFDRIPNICKSIDIQEGVNGTWAFLNVNLDDYKTFNKLDFTNYPKSQALAKLAERDFHGAKDVLDEFLKKKPNDDVALHLLSIISYVLDNNFDALKYIDKAIEINPNYDAYYLNRAMMYSSKKEYDKVLEDLSSAIRCDDKNGTNYYYRARFLFAEKKYEEALKDFNSAISILGDEATDVLRWRGNCKTWLNDFSGACEDWKKAYMNRDYSDEELAKVIRQNCGVIMHKPAKDINDFK